MVVVNFVYTRWPDVCALETAQLVKVQHILGERLGRDVFFYSISIDPEVDTPAVLDKYRRRFGARWTFLTGADIVELRRKLGLYVEEIQDGSNNHNVNMIKSTGRWRKRSPFANPCVLADQLGNWLTAWKTARPVDGYANAPKLRQVLPGERLFRTRCAGCHSIAGRTSPDALGPDLAGVVQRRRLRWLLDWLQAPDRMLAQRDPIAVALYEQYHSLAMPNMRLSKAEALALVGYIDAETRRLRTAAGPAGATAVAARDRPDVVAVANAWIREPHPDAEACAGYMTLVNLGADPVTLLEVRSDAFETVEIHQLSDVDGVMKRHAVTGLEIAANGQLTLRPGGRHLMLTGAQRPLAGGQRVELERVFRSGGTQTLSVEVAAR